MNTDRMTAEQLTQALDRFSGTEKYHRYRGDTLLTDGIKYLAENGDCFWLIDCIADAQTITFLKKAGGLQSWIVTVHQDSSATVTCTTGGGRTIHRKEIAQTDFVLGHDKAFQLFADLAHDHSAIVIFLPFEH